MLISGGQSILGSGIRQCKRPKMETVLISLKNNKIWLGQSTWRGEK